MKHLIFLLLISITFSINSLFAQESPYIPVQNSTSYIPNYSTVDVDELLVIEDVSPELSLDGRKPILLVHGWSFDGKPAPPGGGYWDHFKKFILNDPEMSAKFKPYYVKYWSNYVSINEIAKAMRDKVEEMGLNEQKIVIVGHSMGGLVSRSYMGEQYFTKGISKNKKCGDNVDLLITLGSPHHGAPMANGPARNAKLSFFLQLTLVSVEAAVFKETSYDEVNRVNLHWDNYDGLLDYQKYSNERNTWLENLNNNWNYGNKMVCYSGSVKGVFMVPENGNLEQQYKLGAWFTEQGFNFTNDGIVPIQSAEFKDHTVKRIRHFDEYNHADIIRGKTDKTELFNPLKSDIMEAAPLQINWPDAAGLYVKHSQNRNVTWTAPETVDKVNIYFSSNGGATFSSIASNVDASLGKQNWYVPDINSSNCVIMIENADFKNEVAISSNTFTIFHNSIAINSPNNKTYMVRSHDNVINWTQMGLGKKVKITYTDSKNYITRIISNETATNLGSNTFTWPADETIIPSNTGQIQIQLLDLYENYGDSEFYAFSSGAFELFGDPEFEVVSPESNSTDFLGIPGEQLEIGTNYHAKWLAKGEIKYIELLLCDENKNIIQALASTNNTPALEILGKSDFEVPAIYGDKFYLLGKAGISKDSILIESFSENTFRINNTIKILSPEANSTNVSMQPCFSLETINAATEYTFYLQDTIGSNEHQSWEYQSDNNEICVPAKIENELQPGMVYQLTASAKFDTITSYHSRIYFQTAATAPWKFQLITPSKLDSTEADEIEVVWNRSVGAQSYHLSLKQSNQTIFEQDILEPTDTSFILPFTNLEYYKKATIEVSAINQFGETKSSQSIFKKFKTNINFVSVDDFNLKNYPNPFSNSTYFEFTTGTQSNASIIIFDLLGNSLEKVFEGNIQQGINNVFWENKNLPSGNYIYQLNVDGKKISKVMQIQ